MTLALVGCQKVENTSVSSETPLVEKESSGRKTTPSSTKTSTNPSKPSTPVVSSTDEGKKESTSTSSSVDPYQSGWNKETVDAMLRYLGGQILPYYNVGRKPILEYAVSDADLGILTISSSKEWTKNTASSLADIYSKEGWKILTQTEEEFKATNDDMHLTVVAKSDETDDTIFISVSYDEPYDETSAEDWTDDVKTVFENELGISPQYSYLGTRNPQAEKKSEEDSFITLTGGKWNNQVLDDAETTLKAARYSVTKTETSLTATGKAPVGVDQFTIRISSYKGFVDQAITKIRAEVSLEEGFDPTSATFWPKEVLDLIDANLGNHTVPFVYLGTKRPTAKWSEYSNILTITGGKWDDRIYDLAKKVYVPSENTRVILDDTDKTLTAIIDETDGRQLCITLSKDKDQKKAELDVAYGKSVVVPENASWEETTKDLMKNHLGGHILPYIYLNDTPERTSWNSDYNYLEIVGGEWSNDITSLAKKTLEADNSKEDTNATKFATWTFEDNNSTYTYTSLTANGTISDGSTCKVEIHRSWDSEKKIYAAKMDVEYKQAYKAPDEEKSWDEDTLKAFDTYLHGHTIPYIYLNTDKPTASYDDYYEEFSIVGGDFDAEMLQQAKTSLIKAGWSDATIDTDNEELTASHTFDGEKEDGCTITLTLSADFDDMAMLSFTLKEGFKEGYRTDWDEETRKAMTEQFGEVFPYIYLGSIKDDVTSNTAGMTIDGKAWDDSIIKTGKATLEKAGYTCYESKNSCGPTLTAFKVDDTIYKTNVLMIQKNYSGVPSLSIRQDTGAAIPATPTDWDEDLKTAFKTFTGNSFLDLPYVYLGTGTPSYKTTNYGTSSLDVSVSGTSYYYLVKAIDALKAMDTQEEKWEIDVTPAAYSFKIQAKKSYQSGETLTLSIVKDYSGAMELSAEYTKAA